MSANLAKLREDAERYFRLARAITDRDLMKRFVTMGNELQADADAIEARGPDEPEV